MVKKIGISGMLVATILNGADYIVPPQWDNMVNSVKSQSQVLISNLVSLKSKNAYKLGNKTLHYKCVEVKKIRCANGYTPTATAHINATPTLRDSKKNELIQTYQSDVKIEEKTDSFLVCGGAVGAMTWDKSELKKDKKTGDLTYTYIPNNVQATYWFFTDISGSGAYGDYSGSDNSYMIVDIEQVCR